MSMKNDGTQDNVLEIMQTRMELYEMLGYYDFKAKLDELFASKGD